MIKVKIKNDEIIIRGHAGFADYGKDIVCASVSSMVVASANDMLTVNEKAIKYSDDGDKVIIKIIADDELLSKLLNNLKALLEGLAVDYPKNIIIESEE